MKNILLFLPRFVLGAFVLVWMCFINILKYLWRVILVILFFIFVAPYKMGLVVIPRRELDGRETSPDNK